MLIAPYLLLNQTRVVTVFAFVIWGVLPNVAQAGLFGWQSKVEQLEEKLHQVEAEVSSLKTGLDAIEERARAELGMLKEGETFIQVINQTENDGN